jgi:hypothetical protein
LAGAAPCGQGTALYVVADQLPVAGVVAPIGPCEFPDMPGHWIRVDEPPEPLDPLEPVDPDEVLLLDEGALYVDELPVLPVDPVVAACATAAPPNAPAEASTASTVILRRICVPPLRFIGWLQSTTRR